MADAELPVPPVPVWIRILEPLPVRDRLRAASVCRLWRDLVRDRALWRDVDVRPDETWMTKSSLPRISLATGLCALVLLGQINNG